MQRKARFSLHCRVHCNFGEAKYTNNRVLNKKNQFFFYAKME